MRVSDRLLRDVTLVPSEATVQNAARAIADLDSRVMLVGVEERIVGVLTIRDILIRLVAAGLDPTATPVSQVMSSSLFTCTEADTAESAAEVMAEHRIDQIPVLYAGGRLSGGLTQRPPAPPPCPRTPHSATTTP